MHLLNSMNHTSSMPYKYDDIVWCIQRSKIIPKYINVVRTLPLELWLMVLVGIFVIGTQIYFLIQFDASVKRRNQIDWLYVIVIHTISTFVTVAHTIKPKKSIMRMLYAMEIVIPLFFHGVVGINLYRYMKYDMFYNQISTTRQIAEDNNFRLAGSLEVLHIIGRQPMVCNEFNWMYMYIYSKRRITFEKKIN